MPGADEGFSLAFENGEFTALNLGVIAVLPASLQRLLPRAVEALGGSLLPQDRIDLLRQWIRYDFDDESWFTLLSYVSVFSHELRHYHEYLASPWGQTMLFSWLWLAGMNSGILGSLRDEPSLILPLTSWREVSDENYRLAEAAMSPHVVSRTPPIASWTYDLAANLMKEQHSLTRPMIEGNKPEGNEPDGNEFDLTLLQLLEGTAFFTQLAYLGSIYEEGSSLGWYVEMLKAKDGKRKYTQLLNLWYTLEDRLDAKGAGNLVEPLVPYALRNAVAFYSLCATAESTDPEIPFLPKYHPTSIHFMLWSELLMSGTLPPAGGIMPWLNAAAKKLGLMTLKESLRASVRQGHSRSEWFRRMNAGDGPGKWAPETLAAYDQWIAAHEYMAARILENPEGFFDPQSYVLNVNRWVAPPGYLLTNAGPKIGECLPRLEPKTFAAGDSEAERWSLLAFRNPLPGVPKIDVDAAWTLSAEIRLAAILWTGGSADKMHHTLARAALKAVAKRDWPVYFP